MRLRGASEPRIAPFEVGAWLAGQFSAREWGAIKLQDRQVRFLKKAYGTGAVFPRCTVEGPFSLDACILDEDVYRTSMYRTAIHLRYVSHQRPGPAAVRAMRLQRARTCRRRHTHTYGRHTTHACSMGEITEAQENFQKSPDPPRGWPCPCLEPGVAHTAKRRQMRKSGRRWARAAHDDLGAAGDKRHAKHARAAPPGGEPDDETEMT